MKDWNVNPLWYVGNFKPEDLKRQYQRDHKYVRFTTTIDLTGLIIVESYNSKDLTLLQYSNDLSDFISWWHINMAPFIVKDNTFNIENIKFYFSNFKIIQ